MGLKRERLDDEPPKIYRYARMRVQSRIDEDTIERICELIAEGNSLKDVANSLTISPTTLYEWKRQGEVYLEVGEPDKWSVYGSFVTGMRAASADYAMKVTRRLHNDPDPDWKRFFQIAERRLPETYGKDPRGGSDEDYNPDEQYL